MIAPWPALPQMYIAEPSRNMSPSAAAKVGASVPENTQLPEAVLQDVTDPEFLGDNTHPAPIRLTRRDVGQWSPSALPRMASLCARSRAIARRRLLLVGGHPLPSLSVAQQH